MLCSVRIGEVKLVWVNQEQDQDLSEENQESRNNQLMVILQSQS